LHLAQELFFKRGKARYNGYMEPEITITVTDDAQSGDFADTLIIRKAVFVGEQGVPESLEIDGLDDVCVHVLLKEDGVPMASGRLRPTGPFAKFERIASMPAARGRGYGKRIMEVMHEKADAAFPGLLCYMHAQASVVKFYEKLGWIQTGDPFVEADIDHQAMLRVPPDPARIEKLTGFQEDSFPPEVLQTLREEISTQPQKND
jgi:predicted GNAT family N-acyltransferase